MNKICLINPSISGNPRATAEPASTNGETFKAVDLCKKNGFDPFVDIFGNIFVPPRSLNAFF